MMQDVRFPSLNKLALSGSVHAPAQSNGVAIVLLHGLHATKEQHWMHQWGEELSGRGYTVLRFDFAGNGISEGTFEKDNNYKQAEKDVRGAIAFLREKYAIKSVILVGHSYGGAVAYMGAGMGLVSGVMGLAPVTNPAGIRNRIVRRQRDTVFVMIDTGPTPMSQVFIDSASLDSRALAKMITIPICLIHGTADKTLPLTFSKEFMGFVSVPDKEFFPIEGGEHNFVHKWDDVNAVAWKWIDSHRDAKPNPVPTRFCPKCGATNGEFIGAFCRNCFLEDHPDLAKIPSKLELPRCNRCGKVRIETRWYPWDSERVRAWVASKVNARNVNGATIAIEMTPHPKDEKQQIIVARVAGMVEDQQVDLVLNSTLFLRGGICNDDMLVSSDYHEGVIQVRMREMNPEKIKGVQAEIDKALVPLQKADSKAVVVNWVPQKFGFDAIVVSSKAAKAAAVAVSRLHKGTMSVSGKLIGLDVHSTKQKHRLTFLVRIP